MTFSRIKYTGAYVPDFTIDNDVLSEMVDTSDEWIKSRTGIAKRHISRKENTSDLAANAAKSILQKGNINPLDIELIIIATISGDYGTPSTACLVQAKIGAVNAVAFDISAACSGFVFGLSTAEKFIRTGVYKNALVIGTEVLSKELDFTDRETCVLFGDGAAGVYLEQSEKPGILSEEIGSDGSKGLSLTLGYIPASNPFVEQKQDKAPYIAMDGRAIFEFATRMTPKCIKTLLAKTDISPEDIKYVIPHQANSRIIEVISRKVKIPMEKFYLNIDRFANTSSASIPIALNELVEQGKIQRDDFILLVGFGAGLTWGAMLLKF